MLKNLHLWLPSYLARRRPRRPAGPTHVLFCFADHYEPLWLRPTADVARARVRHWTEHYPPFAERFRDADGRPPQHTFFVPAEEYRPEFLEPLARLCARGYGEVEVHLHHDNDTPENLTARLSEFKSQLRQHGCLPADPRGNLRYGFIHGNWALDNSRADRRWCGVNNELQVLRETGCYADFTLPSAPSDTQTRKINAIYYATDDPHRPKSHDTGEDVRVRGEEASGVGFQVSGSRTGHGTPRDPDTSAKPERPSASALTPETLLRSEPQVLLRGRHPTPPLPDRGDLLLIQGPLGLNWRERKWGLLPRIEHADVARHTPVTPSRIDLWMDLRIGVVGRPDWVFVKVHTHGAQEANFDATHGAGAEQMHEYLQARYNDGHEFRLHYVTARELYNVVKAAEAGQAGDPGQYRDFVLPPPPVRAARA